MASMPTCGSSHISGLLKFQRLYAMFFGGDETDEIDDDRLQVCFLSDMKTAGTRPEVVTPLALE